MMEDNLQSVTIMTVIISNNDTLGPNASTTTKENLELGILSTIDLPFTSSITSVMH